jgi:hypothetical protein
MCIDRSPPEALCHERTRVCEMPRSRAAASEGPASDAAAGRHAQIESRKTLALPSGVRIRPPPTGHRACATRANGASAVVADCEAAYARRMAGEPIETTSNPNPDRRPAVWPWLLIPLVALLMFFALQKVKSTPRAEPAATAEESAAPAEP